MSGGRATQSQTRVFSSNSRRRRRKGARDSWPKRISLRMLRTKSANFQNGFISKHLDAVKTWRNNQRNRPERRMDCGSTDPWQRREAAAQTGLGPANYLGSSRSLMSWIGWARRGAQED